MILALALSGCDGSLQLPGSAPSSTSKTVAAERSSGSSTATSKDARAAAAALGRLVVKGRAPMTGYTRAAFGPAWADVDHNGCDTRNDILGRDLTTVTYKPETHDCVVLTGTLADPYTGRRIAFQRGEGTSAKVQIDHVVALGDAWATGADRLTAPGRELLANDPLELLAVDGPTNESKGDGDAATWLPPNKSFRCSYVIKQVGVKAKYGLWVTPAEKAAMAGILSKC